MATPICIIDANGITAPTFADCLAYFQAQYRGIYGQDIYTAPDSQDGQFLGLLAAALNDTNAQTVAAYNAFSPSTAQGIGLSSNVKINGISRKVPSYSTCDLALIGQAGSVITNGVASDQNSSQWNLPANVVIPLSGVIIVTATAANLGAITAPAGTITTIATPTRGWQSVSNPNDATPGKPIQSDAELRLQQSGAAAMPSARRLDGIVAGIAVLPDVVAHRAYENDSWSPDTNGIPAHSLALVVDGGDAFLIAVQIFIRKFGTSTYGTTKQNVVDLFGIPHVVSFFRPTKVPITYGLNLKALKGFTTDIQVQVQQAISDWTNGLGVGNSLLLNRAFVPANLAGAAAGQTFEVTALTVARDGGGLAASDITIAFNEQATCATTSISVTVSS